MKHLLSLATINCTGDALRREPIDLVTLDPIRRPAKAKMAISAINLVAAGAGAFAFSNVHDAEAAKALAAVVARDAIVSIARPVQIPDQALKSI